MSKDHSQAPLECAIFYMDMRTQGKDFDRYTENARKNGVRFIPARIHTIEPIPGTDDLRYLMWTMTDSARKKLLTWWFFPPGWKSARIPSNFQIAWALRWTNIILFEPTAFIRWPPRCQESMPAGFLPDPKEHPQSVMEASAAACAATENLAARPQHPHRDPSREKCDPRSAENRGFRLQLRHQYRRHCRRAVGGSICRRPCRGWLLWKKICSPAPRIPRSVFPIDPRQRAQPGRDCRLHAAHP